MIATLINKAPAKVVPMALKSLLDLKSGIRRGMVPTNSTMKIKSSMKTTLRTGSNCTDILDDAILY